MYKGELAQISGAKHRSSVGHRSSVSHRNSVSHRSNGRSLFEGKACVPLCGIMVLGFAYFSCSGLTLLNFTSAPRSFSAELRRLSYEVGESPIIEGRDNGLFRLSPADRRKIPELVAYIAEVIGDTTVHGKEEPWELATLIVRESLREGFNPLFVASLIKQESHFDSRAISTKGARGLMQILPTTAEYIAFKQGHTWLGVKHLHDPGYNIRLGLAYLRYLEQMFSGNREHTLVAYNWGPGRLTHALRSRAYIPTAPVSYARRIISHEAKWKSELEAKVATYRMQGAFWNVG